MQVRKKCANQSPRSLDYLHIALRALPEYSFIRALPEDTPRVMLGQCQQSIPCTVGED